MQTIAQIGTPMLKLDESDRDEISQVLQSLDLTERVKTISRGGAMMLVFPNGYTELDVIDELHDKGIHFIRQ